MKLVIGLGLVLLASCSALPTNATRPEDASGDNRRVAVYLGQRNLDHGDYDPVDEQFTLGAEFSSESAGSAIGWEIGYMGSSDDSGSGSSEVRGKTREFYGGVRKSFGDGTVRPYIGGGLSFINSEIEAAGFGTHDDDSAGLYLHGGVTFDVSKSFYMGLDLRALGLTDMNIAGVDTDADYVQFAFLAGVRF